MKSISARKKCFLFPYREMINRLNIPHEYFLVDLKHCGGDVVLQLVKVAGFASNHGEIVDFNLKKEQKKYIFLKIEEFERKLNITLKNPRFFFCFKEKEGLMWRGEIDLIFFAREMLGKEMFVLIEQENLVADYHHVEFVKADWQEEGGEEYERNNQ